MCLVKAPNYRNNFYCFLNLITIISPYFQFKLINVSQYFLAQVRHVTYSSSSSSVLRRPRPRSIVQMSLIGFGKYRHRSVDWFVVLLLEDDTEILSYFSWLTRNAPAWEDSPCNWKRRAYRTNIAVLQEFNRRASFKQRKRLLKEVPDAFDILGELPSASDDSTDAPKIKKRKHSTPRAPVRSSSSTERPDFSEEFIDRLAAKLFDRLKLN